MNLTRSNILHLALVAFALPSLSKASSCVNATDVCGPGCWSPDNVFLKDGNLHCVSVGPGYYSPADSNERFACAPGHVASDDDSAECTPCPSGSMAFPDGIRCMRCPPGTYQDTQGKVECQSCNPRKYNGEGSNAVTDDGYCLFINDSGGHSNRQEPAMQETISEEELICVNTPGTCDAGCWNDDGIILDNGTRLCVPVEPGYYSPSGSNMRLKCEKGHFSSEYQAPSCIACEPGSIAVADGTGCMPCPRGTYQDAYGGKVCYSCNSDIYSRPGANRISSDGHCLLVQSEWKTQKESFRVEKNRRLLR